LATELKGQEAQVKRFVPKKKVCFFCAENIDEIDYKQPELLRRFLSEWGRIQPRRKTGTCARHQRKLSLAIKRARFLGLLPFTSEHIRKSGM